MAGRGTAATMALERAGIPFTVHEYAHDRRHESYGREASEALGVSPDRVFKTLIAGVDGTVPAGRRLPRRDRLVAQPVTPLTARGSI